MLAISLSINRFSKIRMLREAEMAYYAFPAGKQLAGKQLAAYQSHFVPLPTFSYHFHYNVISQISVRVPFLSGTATLALWRIHFTIVRHAFVPRSN